MQPTTFIIEKPSTYSIYAQDEIRFSSELTLNLGLRYERYTVSKDVYIRERVFDIVRCQCFCPLGNSLVFSG